MKFSVACLLAAVALLQGATGDYSAGSCTYDARNPTAIVSSVGTVVSNLCVGVTATAGLEGCFNLLNTVVGQLGLGVSLSSAICISEFEAYANAIVAVFLQKGWITLEGGIYVLAVAEGSIDLNAVVSACAGVAVLASVVVVNGLIFGVAATLTVAVITALNALLAVVAKVVGIVGCIGTTCAANLLG